MKKLPFCERVCHKQNFTNETFYFGDVWLLFALPWTPPPPHVYRKHEVTNMGLHLTSVGSHSRLFESLSSMLSRSALNPADISIVRLYCIAPLTSIHCVDIGMTHFISHTYWSETCLCWHLWLKKTLKTTTYLCPSIACTSLISEERPPPSSVGSLVIVMDRTSSMSIDGVYLLSFLQLYKHYTEDDPPPPVQFLQTPHLLGLYGEYFLFVKFSCRPTKFCGIIQAHILCSLIFRVSGQNLNEPTVQTVSIVTVLATVVPVQSSWSRRSSSQGRPSTKTTRRSTSTSWPMPPACTTMKMERG